MTFRRSRSPLAGLIVVMLAIMAGAADAGTGLQGSVLDDLQLGLIDGTLLDTADAYGTATVVGVWATWCPACRKELPDLLELERELGEQGMRLVLVSVDNLPSRGERYLERLGYEGMIAYDPGARSIISRRCVSTRRKSARRSRRYSRLPAGRGAPGRHRSPRLSLSLSRRPRPPGPASPRSSRRSRPARLPPTDRARNLVRRCYGPTSRRGAQRLLRPPGRSPAV